MADADDVLDALEAIHREEERPIATAPEIAEGLDVQRRRVLQLLDALEAVGAVESHPVARGRAFWSTERVRIKSLPPEVPPAETSEDPASAPPADPQPTPHPAFEDLEDVVRDLESIPGQKYSPERYEERVEAILAVLEELESAGDLKASEIRDRVYQDHPAGYSEGENPPLSWWKNCVGPALSELQEKGITQLVDSHDGIWSLGRR